MTLPPVVTIEIVMLFAAFTFMLCGGLIWRLSVSHTSEQNRLKSALAEVEHQQELMQQSQRQTEDLLDQAKQSESEKSSQLEKLQQQYSSQRETIVTLQTRLEQEESTSGLVAERDQEISRLKTQLSTQQASHDGEKQALEEKLKLLSEAREQLSGEFKLLANKIFEEKQRQFHQDSQRTLNASVDPLKQQIESFRKKVEDVYDKENAERNKLVGSIVELQKQTLKIGEDAINLTQALKGDNKAQGNWGEVILERLLEESGLQKGREYEVQVALKDEEGKRRNPDVILRLPEGKDVVIDSKVSLLAYEQSVSADSEEARRQALKQHVASVRTHIQQLSGKSYEKLEGIRSLDFVFLFIPVEAAFMAAMQEAPAIFQEAYSKHIVVVSPTTLLASLRTVENIWRYEKQNRNAEEIARQAGGLHDQFVLLLESFEEIGKQLDKAQAAFATTQKRWVSGRGNLMRRVDSLRLLGAKTKKRLDLDKDATEEAELLVGSSDSDADS